MKIVSRQQLDFLPAKVCLSAKCNFSDVQLAERLRAEPGNIAAGSTLYHCRRGLTYISRLHISLKIPFFSLLPPSRLEEATAQVALKKMKLEDWQVI